MRIVSRAEGVHKSDNRAVVLQVNPTRGGPVADVEVLRRVVQRRITPKRGKTPTAPTGVRQIV